MCEKTELLATCALRNPVLEKHEFSISEWRQEGQEAAEKGSRVVRDRTSYS